MEQKEGLLFVSKESEDVHLLGLIVALEDRLAAKNYVEELFKKIDVSNERDKFELALMLQEHYNTLHNPKSLRDIAELLDTTFESMLLQKRLHKIDEKERKEIDRTGKAVSKSVFNLKREK
jgi:hypothetical protein